MKESEKHLEGEASRWESRVENAESARAEALAERDRLADLLEVRPEGLSFNR